MSQAADFISAGWWCVLAALARAGGFAALAPTAGLGTEGVKHRVVLAILLTLMLLPLDQIQNGITSDAPPVAFILQGLAAGCLLGFALRALLSGITMAAQLMEQQLGFAFLDDPDDEASASAISRLYQILAIALFFSFGGHRLVLAGLMDASSGKDWAVGSGVDVVELAVGLVSHTCWFALQMAAPLAIALLTTSLTVGMISRVLPQSSVSTIALPAQVAFGLVLILLSLTAVVPAVRGELAGALGWTAASR